MSKPIIVSDNILYVELLVKILIWRSPNFFWLTKFQSCLLKLIIILYLCNTWHGIVELFKQQEKCYGNSLLLERKEVESADKAVVA